MSLRIEPLTMTQKIKNFWIWLNELNLFKYDSKNWFFSIWPREIDFFVECDSKNSTFFQCDSKIFFSQNDSKHWPFLKYDSKNWFFFFEKMTHRIEPFFSIWLKELNLLQNMTQKIEPLFKLWLEESNIFSIELFQSDLKNWTLFWFDLKNWLFLEDESNNWTLFEHDSQICFFWKNITQRIEPFFWISLAD